MPATERRARNPKPSKAQNAEMQNGPGTPKHPEAVRAREHPRTRANHAALRARSGFDAGTSACLSIRFAIAASTE